jgi:hypothetical protein
MAEEAEENLETMLPIELFDAVLPVLCFSHWSEADVDESAFPLSALRAGLPLAIDFMAPPGGGNAAEGGSGGRGLGREGR